MNKMVDNKMKMEIMAKLENVSVVRVAISSFVSNLNITIDELMDIKTAVSEAVTNAIEHGYEITEEEQEGEDMVVVEATIQEGERDRVQIVIRDEGIGIEDVSLAMTPAYTSKPELEHAGMGFTIMETFMDEIIIDSTKDQGTSITLTKSLKKRKSSHA